MLLFLVAQTSIITTKKLQGKKISVAKKQSIFKNLKLKVTMKFCISSRKK